MSPRKHHEDEDDEGYEGFERNPVFSEEIIVQPSSPHQGTFLLFNSIVQERKQKASRYASQEKPGFKLKALGQGTRQMKKSENLKRPHGLSSQESEQIDVIEEDNCESLIFARKQKKLGKNRSNTHFQEAAEGAVIKSKRAEIVQNITTNADSRLRDTSLSEEMTLHPCSEIVYKENIPDSTFTYFKRLLKNSEQSSFLESKHNKALRVKMEKAKMMKEEQLYTERLRVTNSIEFSGDFESGNLDFVLKNAEDQFNVFLRIDTNTRGHQSWFYFKTSNNFAIKKRIRINICNVKRRFRMIESGQKIYVKEMSPLAGWTVLNEDVSVKANGKAKYKLSFGLSLNPHQEMLVSLIPPYTYSNLLKDLDGFESSPNFRMDTLTHTITGLAVPLVTITKGAAKELKSKLRLKKKLILISGRIHPSQTCSSFIINGIIQELLQNEEHLNQFLSNNIVKIIPMLNPDGVVFGNFRTNYLGDDLNRSFHKSDQSVFPETTALKQLGKQFQAEFGQNFVGFLDMHGHSGQTNSFVYGPQYEQNSESFVECRVLPKILDKLSKYFKYEMCEFKLQEYKSNTARGYFLKKLKVPSYTIQTSYALYKDKSNGDQKPKPMSIPEWKQYGREIAVSLSSYFRYLQPTGQNNSIFKRVKDRKVQPSPEKQNGSISSFSCIDYYALKKEIQKQSANVGKNKWKEVQSQDSDGQSLQEDLPEGQKQALVKRIKVMMAPSLLLPKVAKTSLNLPSVIPSMIYMGRAEDRITSMMPKLVNKYRNKKLVRPLNLSYEYTQYLLKNISDIGSLKPQVLQFSADGRKKGGEATTKKHSILQF